MEVHKFICDCCGKELDKTKWTISQHYQGNHWDGMMEEYEKFAVDNTYHLCDECWKKFEGLIIK